MVSQLKCHCSSKGSLEPWKRKDEHSLMLSQHLHGCPLAFRLILQHAVTLPGVVWTCPSKRGQNKSDFKFGGCHLAAMIFLPSMTDFIRSLGASMEVDCWIMSRSCGLAEFLEAGGENHDQSILLFLCHSISLQLDIVFSQDYLVTRVAVYHVFAI